MLKYIFFLLLSMIYIIHLLLLFDYIVTDRLLHLHFIHIFDIKSKKRLHRT